MHIEVLCSVSVIDAVPESDNVNDAYLIAAFAHRSVGQSPALTGYLLSGLHFTRRVVPVFTHSDMHTLSHNKHPFMTQTNSPSQWSFMTWPNGLKNHLFNCGLNHNLCVVILQAEP